MQEERTLIIVKPDGVRRGLVGEVIRRFEAKGFKLRAVKMTVLSPEKARRHYAEHEGKPFYDDLIRFITSGPVVLMVWSGINAVDLARRLIGATDPHDAEPGSIRGDYVTQTCCNIIHGSDSRESAEREIANFFSEVEILDY